MERKKTWYELSQEEKTELLMFWFHYYGGLVYTMDERDKFQRLAERRQDDIFAHIVTRSIYENTVQSSVLLTSMRKKKVEELFKTSISRKKLDDEGKRYYDTIAEAITDSMIEDYNESQADGSISFVIVVPDEKGNQNFM